MEKTLNASDVLTAVCGLWHLVRTLRVKLFSHSESEIIHYDVCCRISPENHVLRFTYQIQLAHRSMMSGVELDGASRFYILDFQFTNSRRNT